MWRETERPGAGRTWAEASALRRCPESSMRPSVHRAEGGRAGAARRALITASSGIDRLIIRLMLAAALVPTDQADQQVEGLQC